MATIPLSPGASLRYSIDNFDSADTYLFTLEPHTDGIRFRWRLEGCDDAGEITAAAPLLREAQGVLMFSQGTANEGDRWFSEGALVDHLPPYLAARAWLEKGRRGEPLVIAFDGQELLLTPSRRSVVRVMIDGTETQVEGLHWHHSDGEMVVQDDLEHPVLLTLTTCGGDNGATLRAFGSQGLKPLTRAELDAY